MHFQASCTQEAHYFTVTTTTVILHALLLVEDLVQRVSTEFRHPFFSQIKSSPEKLTYVIQKLDKYSIEPLSLSVWPASAAETNNLT